jgi:uncharacterized protein (DUF952 family)
MKVMDMAKWIYKLAPQSLWQEAQQAGIFEGAPVDLEDGFIHFSTAAQVQETAAKHFAGQQDLLLLVIAVDSLEEMTGPLKWEPSRGGDLFPHLYAKLPLEAVIAQASLALGPDGLHQFPPLPQDPA